MEERKERILSCILPIDANISVLWQGFLIPFHAKIKRNQGILEKNNGFLQIDGC